MTLPRREFLMQAHKLDLSKADIRGWWASEKLDGTRAFWDGGVSRGVPTVEVPWANIFHPKTGKLKTTLKPIATGLWSRYANPIIAPDSFLNKLPACPLDGELFAGRGNFQLCRSIVSGNTSGPDWDKIEFAVFSCPPLSSIFSSGSVKGPQMVRDLHLNEIVEWLRERKKTCSIFKDFAFLDGFKDFEDELDFLQNMIPVEGTVYLHNQRKLPLNKPCEYVETYMGSILDKGGEGLVVRDPEQRWIPKRSRGLLKYKPFSDDEGTITGFVSGRKTEKGSKLLGLIGALILDYKGKRLELSGLTNEEREFSCAHYTRYATSHPGEDMLADAQGRFFKVGDKVTFKYRELSDDGLPKEARYWRKRSE